MKSFAMKVGPKLCGQLATECTAFFRKGHFAMLCTKESEVTLLTSQYLHLARDPIQESSEGR